ncbi:MAG: hypothetical protein VYA34_08515 [Myxococcota bacterium]|nr:hypothetical protein [Myxococcota bacterium]
MSLTNVQCDWRQACLPNWSENKTVGYLPTLTILDYALEPDIVVYSPYKYDDTSAPDFSLTGDDDTGLKTGTVAAILDSYSWGGAAGDALRFSVYVSSANFNQLSAKKTDSVGTSDIANLNYWACQFDQEEADWFERCFPAVALQGKINDQGGTIQMTLASSPTQIAPNIKIDMYNMYFEVVPDANVMSALNFATAKNSKTCWGWGIKVNAA